MAKHYSTKDFFRNTPNALKGKTQHRLTLRQALDARFLRWRGTANTYRVTAWFRMRGGSNGAGFAGFVARPVTEQSKSSCDECKSRLWWYGVTEIGIACPGFVWGNVWGSF